MSALCDMQGYCLNVSAAMLFLWYDMLMLQNAIRYAQVIVMIFY
jgi:hypothetical protein